MEQDSTYNGWINYETWATHLWLTGDEQIYRSCQLHATTSRESAPVCDQVSQKIWSVEEATRFLLADRLKKNVEDESPLSDGGTLYSDLLESAISEIDWHEIADAFLEE
jgi:hypothetical protein